MAYLGALSGFEFISDVVRSPEFARYTRALMDIDVSPTLNVPPGFDLNAYKNALMDRFANPMLRHRTTQIAMDGSQKLPYRLLSTISSRLMAGQEPRYATLAVAAWIRYVSVGESDSGVALPLDDPIAEKLRSAARAASSPDATVAAFLAVGEVFPPDLAEDHTFQRLLSDALASLATLRCRRGGGRAGILGSRQAMKERTNRTVTSAFGVGRREGHDASGFYARFEPPEMSGEEDVEPLAGLPQGAAACIEADSRRLTLPGGPPLPANSVALVVTSPPYFSGKEYEQALGRGHIPGSYLEYLGMLRDVFAECKRALEPGGRIAVNVANLGRKPYRSLSADVVRILQDDLRLLLRGEVVWRKGEGANSSCAWGSFRSRGQPGTAGRDRTGDNCQQGPLRPGQID